MPNDDLPEPEGPIRRTSDSSGMSDLHATTSFCEKTAICVGAPRSASTGPTASKRTPYPNRSATPLAQPSNSARFHSKRWSPCLNSPAGSVGKSALYSCVRCRQYNVSRAARTQTDTLSKAARRGPSRCSITSTTAAASNPFRRSSRYISEPLDQLQATALLAPAAGPASRRSRLRRSIATSSDRYATSIPTIRSNCLSSISSLNSLPDPQPRSRTCFAPVS